jgi:uncharacterized protein
MARIVVFGAAGKAGRLITAEAAHRGHDVVAVARDPAKVTPPPNNVTVQAGDATSASSIRQLSVGADAVVIAIGGEDPSVLNRAARTMMETLNELPGIPPRIIHLGGGATLLTPDGKRFLDLRGTFPEEFRAPAEGQAEALETYREANGSRVSWTYLSPPPVHLYPGTRTGTYRTGLDHPVTDARGEATLSYEDLAVAIVDEIEQPRFLNQRFTAGY